MREIIALLREADAILCDRSNALLSHGETTITSFTLRRLSKAREGIWQARRALGEKEEKTCEKS